MTDPKAGLLPTVKPDLAPLRQAFFRPAHIDKIKFGTSGHRGKLGAGFAQIHAKAIAQAVAKYHKENKIKGPVLIGGDTRLMSKDTCETCACVLAANGIEVILPQIPVPTPVLSHAILTGVAVACLNATASHNPPEDMGLKYNPKTGGPASGAVTAQIEIYANEFLSKPAEIKEMPLAEAKKKKLIKDADLVKPYVTALQNVIDFDAIKTAALKTAIHPMGGASLPFYQAIKKQYGLDNMEIVSTELDPAFGFIPLDHDGKTRMDPSSPYPMKPLIELVKSGTYDFAGASDPDADRFGCATAKGGLIAPNHALCVMADYLARREEDIKARQIGRTLGTTHLLDRIAAQYKLGADEQNIGFKYFVDGILDGKYLLCGEESAGMSMSGWTTEKDGIFAVLLLLEIMSKEDDIANLYTAVTKRLGTPHYTRIDIPTDEETKNKIKTLKAASVKKLGSVAGEKITRVRDTDGIKCYLQDSWFLVRPSGTENIIKFYCESFKGRAQMEAVIHAGAEALGIKLN